MDAESSIVADVELVLVLVLGRLLFALSVCLLVSKTGEGQARGSSSELSGRKFECRYNRSCIGTWMDR